MVTRTKKIFVGGLSAPTTLEDVKSYFEQFGPVSEENCFPRYIYISITISMGESQSHAKMLSEMKQNNNHKKSEWQAVEQIMQSIRTARVSPAKYNVRVDLYIYFSLFFSCRKQWHLHWLPLAMFCLINKNAKKKKKKKYEASEKNL